MFDADRPITSSTQDRLNRAVFAKYLARCMLDHKNPDSLVIGLYGGWGAGKTSIINMAIEELNLAAANSFDDEKPVILNFSPWSYSGQNQLLYNFFRRLSSTLSNAPHLENADRIIYLLELYVSFFTNKPIPQALCKKRFGWSKHKNDLYAWESGRDLTQVKSELNGLLKNQKHKIIIVIDNIARLHQYEIQQIFQIVKSIGDYANTVYLLALDKEHVVRVIGEGGNDYVEKIVQLPFTVPPILQQDIEAIFYDRLSEILTIVPSDRWNTEYWADIYYDSLKYFFYNCRDITRYINTVGFSYPRLQDIVNPIDFFALTAIEVFTPEIYYGIRDNKDLFTDLLDNVYVIDKASAEEDRSRCDEILSRNTHIPREILLELLIRLFPRIRKIYRPKELFYHSDAAARMLYRICSPDIFDAYFRLSMQTGQILASEFDTILAMTSHAEYFDQALTRLNQDDRIIKFLDLLNSKILQTITKENIPPIVNALIDNGDLFPHGVSNALNLNTPMKIHRILHELLRRFESSEERFLLMQNAIAKATKSIYISIHELREQNREHAEETDTFIPLSYRDLSPEQLISLNKLAVNRIELWAKDDRLVDHPQLISILFAWRDWSKSDACQQYVAKMTETDRGLLSFLTAILNSAISETMTEYHKNPDWEHYLDDINSFIPPQDLAKHAALLFEDEYFEKLREREQLALMIFLDLLNVPTNKIIRKTSV